MVVTAPAAHSQAQHNFMLEVEVEAADQVLLIQVAQADLVWAVEEKIEILPDHHLTGELTTQDRVAVAVQTAQAELK
jgi:hypothetical protein